MDGSSSGGGDSVETLRAVRRLYDDGRYLGALEAGGPLGPLPDWSGAEARLLGARLALQLGAPRAALRHRLRAWREAPASAEVIYYRAVTIGELDGPYPCWRFLAAQGDLADATADTLASWACLHATTLGSLRDFDRSDAWLDRAERADPGNPWIATCRSGLLVHQDRLADAIALVDEALGRKPWFRPAVQLRVSLLALDNRDEEAFAFLREATERLECGPLWLQLALLLVERDDLDGAEAALDRHEALSPLLERSAAGSFLALRAFLAYRRGDDARAIDCLRRDGDEAARKLLDRLSDPARKDLARTVLSVPFVRQHRLTCAPATLTAISRHWNRPADHLEVAERICYDGTSTLSERRWAEGEGWAVREFTVTEESAASAIGAGIPFTLTTNDPGSSHLQAVVGVDRRRGTVVIRDPGTPLRMEMFADVMAEEYGAFGPRGMAMVPAEERGRLEALDLPDADDWNALSRIDGFLEAHRRDEAAACLDGLREASPEGVVTLMARRRLAHYDSDTLADLAVVETLRERFPDCDLLEMTRLAHLGTLSRQEERRATLEEKCRRPLAHPMYASMLAADLVDDASQRDRVRALAARVLRHRPTDPVVYDTLARLAWNALDFETGLELRRFAACLDDKDERLADAYFLAARHCGRTEEALDRLRWRFARFGHKSGQPARTLDAALSRLDRPAEGLAVLEEALAKRPGDGELALTAAWASLGLRGGLEKARAFLARARFKVPEVPWLECAAAIETFAGDRAAALDLAKRAADAQPLSVRLHAAVAAALAEGGDRQAALDYLAATGERFPHLRPLSELRLEWLRGEPAEKREPIVRRLLEADPANAWAARELGFLLVEERRLDEADEAHARAAALDPEHVAVFHLRGAIAAARGDLEGTREAHRGALARVIDDDWSLDGLLEACRTQEERKEALAFVRAEIVRQPIYGDGLLTYRRLAAQVLEPDELLGHLAEAHAARPDLWHAWAALAIQQAAMDRLDEADATIREACRRFPHLPRLWYDRSRVARLRNDDADEIASLSRALEINPLWQEAIRLLSEAHQRRGDRHAARRLLERAVAGAPNDGVSRGWLADVLWADGERAGALAEIERAVSLAPGYDWAWDRLREWSLENDEPERAAAAARRRVERSPHDPRAWERLAAILPDSAAEERLGAVRHARRLAPHDDDLTGLEARLLADDGRFDEALVVCRSRPDGGAIPPPLVAREAWILWCQGHREEGVARLRAALADDPTMTGGWYMLLSWLGECGTPGDRVEVAEQLVRLAPHDPGALGALGETLLEAGDSGRARAVLARAHDASTGDSSNGNRLFDLLFDAGDLDEARSLVAGMLRRCPDPWVFARGIRVAAAQDDFAFAATLLRRLCLENATEAVPGASWPFRTATTACEERGWGGRAAALVGPLLDDPACHPEAAWLWIRCLAPRGGVDGLAAALSHLGKPACGQALAGWVESSVAADDRRGFRRAVSMHADRLMADLDAWGAILLGWTLFREWQGRDGAIRWAAAHPRHPEAPAWMLVNVAEILRVHRRLAEAAEVSRRGIDLPGDYPRMLHSLWLATDCLRAGDEAAIPPLLANAPRGSQDADYGFLHDCLSICAEIAALPRRERKRAFPAAARHLDALAAEYANWSTEPARVAVHGIARRRLAALVGGPRAGWWYLNPAGRTKPR